MIKLDILDFGGWNAAGWNLDHDLSSLSFPDAAFGRLRRFSSLAAALPMMP
jgi:hypothetical protein